MQSHGTRADAEIDGRIGPGRRLLVDDAAGMTRLSWPPQLTPNLNRRRPSQKRTTSMPPSSSMLNRPELPVSCLPSTVPSRVGCSTRVTARMLAQRRGDRDGAALVRPHPQIQRAHAAHQQPALERRQLGAEIGQHDPVEIADQLGRAGHDAGHRVAVAAQIFRGRVHTRSAPCCSGRWKIGLAQLLSMIVTAPSRRAMRRQPGDVLDLEHPAGRALEVEHTGADQGALHGHDVAPVDIVDRDAHARQQDLEEPVGVGVDVPHAHHPVAALHLAEHAPLIAAMPLAKPRAASAPSSRASLSSNTAVVGLPTRL